MRVRRARVIQVSYVSGNICESYDFALKVIIISTQGNTQKVCTWIQKCVLVLTFANAFKIAEFAKLKK